MMLTFNSPLYIHLILNFSFEKSTCVKSMFSMFVAVFGKTNRLARSMFIAVLVPSYTGYIHVPDLNRTLE